MKVEIEEKDLHEMNCELNKLHAFATALRIAYDLKHGYTEKENIENEIEYIKQLQHYEIDDYSLNSIIVDYYYKAKI